jgi:oligosaccharide repeat unit polymerase
VTVGFLALFVALLACNYWVLRSLLYPAALFAAIWTIAVAGAALAPFGFYAVSAEALTIFYMGALAFSCGGACALLSTGVQIENKGQAAALRADSRRRLDMTLFVVLCGLPLYLTRVSRLAEGAEVQTLFATIRLASVSETNRGWEERIAENFMLLALFLALALFYENDGSRRRRLRVYAGVGLALVYGILTAGKSTVVSLVLMMLAISWLRKGRAQVIPLVVSVLAIVVTFTAGVVLVNWFGEIPNADWEGVTRVAEIWWNYGVGGLVAFSEILARPSDAGWTGGVYRPLLQIANALGGKVDVPFLHAEYTSISPHASTNVYTIYWLYVEDFGVVGSLLMMLGLGAAVTWLYLAARMGHVLAILLYALAFTGSILTIHGEHFITGLTSYGKALVFWLLIYTPFWSRSNHSGASWSALPHTPEA